MFKLAFIMHFNILSFLLFFYSSTILAMYSSNETDLQSLIAFKKSIVDPHGVLTSWDESVHHCSWEGIDCSKRHSDRVFKIKLRSQGLIGSLSPHLGNLSFLTFIILQNNSFYGPIPDEIGRLRRLQFVEFSNNSFSGEIPRNISQCTNIFYLNLIDNNLSGIIIPELGSLLKLKTLRLSKNYLPGTIPPFIANLTNLRWLSLADCGMEGEIPESFAQLQSLWYLSLSENNLIGRVPNDLYNISAMSILSLANNQLHGTIRSVCFTSQRLMILDLFGNHFTGEIPTSISNSSLLQVINLSSNNFAGKVMIDFSRLSALKEFLVWENNMEGNLNFISSMSNCTRLKVVDISNNSFCGSLPNSISNLSSQVFYLSLAMNKLHGNISSDIGNLLGLTTLDISFNEFEGPIPFQIAKLKNLQILSLAVNKLTNEIPLSIGNLTLLNALDLGQNYLYGGMPQSLINCTKLLFINLSQNNLNGPIAREIMSISSISIAFDLSYNDFTGTIPSEIGSLIHLANLDLSNNRLLGLIPDSLSQCMELDQIKLGSNYFSGPIPESFRNLRGVTYIDLSRNDFSGQIPNFLGDLKLVYLNLSFNRLEGQVPTVGVFQNKSAVSLEGNIGLCGGIANLRLWPCSLHTSKKKHFLAPPKVLIPCAIMAIIICLSSCFFCILICRKRILINVVSFAPSIMEDMRLSYADLLKATDGFSTHNLLGAGSFGTVYKGILKEGQALVAIKVINLDNKGASRSFMSECITLGQIRHRNLVKLVRACSSTDFQGNGFKALVYDFKANGNLDEWLHKKSNDESCQGREIRKLSLRQRLYIALDIAYALEYLHCGTISTIIHGDLKPSNILLDENMTAHVGDFGLAKVFSGVFSIPESSTIGIKGTIGYIPPEYGMSGMISMEGDVYSYGILLLEMFTGRRLTNNSFENYSTIHELVKSAFSSQVMNVLDPYILQEEDFEIKSCIISVLGIALACSKELPRHRMKIVDVVIELHKIIHASE